MSSLLAWRPWCVAALAATLFLTNLGASHLWDDDEPKNARCGAEMYESGEWVVPTFNGELRSHKPVLLYWTMIASYSAFGVSEFSARLPSALAAILVVVMTYHMARLLFDKSTGLLAAVLLSTGLWFTVLARAATPDGVLMVCITSGLLAFVHGVASRRGGKFSGPGGEAATPLASLQLPWVHTFLMYGALGLALLAKGPIGFVMPLLAVVLFGLFGEPVDNSESAKAPSGLRAWFAWFLASVSLRRWAEGSDRSAC